MPPLFVVPWVLLLASSNSFSLKDTNIKIVLFISKLVTQFLSLSLHVHVCLYQTSLHSEYFESSIELLLILNLPILILFCFTNNKSYKSTGQLFSKLMYLTFLLLNSIQTLSTNNRTWKISLGMCSSQTYRNFSFCIVIISLWFLQRFVTLPPFEHIICVYKDHTSFSIDKLEGEKVEVDKQLGVKIQNSGRRGGSTVLQQDQIIVII